MSDRLRSPSRRALLRAAGLVPFVLVGARTLSAEATAEIEALPKPSTLSENEKEKLGRIMTRLWSMFEAGVTDVVKVEHGVVQKAWDLSGPSLIKHLKDWPDDKDHDRTLGCAYECGTRARDLAVAGKVTPTIFEDAWGATEKRQGLLLKKLNEKRKGKDVVKTWGLGCG